jgi:serine/threonine protein kinase/signal peptidase I
MDTKRICTVCGKTLTPGAPEGLCPECLLKAGLGTGVDIGADTGKAPRFVPPKIEELAAKFPQLEILEFIGQGGMGAVYKARQKQLDRIVALKILPPQAAGGPGFAERFTREARALARLNHPHIVTLYEFGQADGLFYFLMEFVDGVNLRLLLTASRMASREALAIVPQICEALQFAHDTGIVHRDIKPENILLDKKGQVKIADFGVAKLVTQGMEETAAEKTASSGDLTEAGSSLGTPQYMAPEQIKNSAEVDHRADIYSLGVVFYQMLTGELPSGKIEPPSRKVVIDVRLDEVVLRALEKKPELRYQQVSEVKTMVETIATTPQPSPPPATPPGWKHYKDDQWGYELDLPPGWNPFPPMRSNSPYEVIRFMSHENGKHILIIFRKPHDPATSLKHAADWARQYLVKAGFGNFIHGETSIGTKPALMLDFDRPQDRGTWSCREYFISEGTLGYVVGFGTTDKARMFETFDRMAKSFQFRPEAYPEHLVRAGVPMYLAPKTKTVAAEWPNPESSGQMAGAELPSEGYSVRIEPNPKAEISDHKWAFIKIPFVTLREGNPKTSWLIILAAGLLLEFLVLWALILRAALRLPDVLGVKVIWVIVLPIITLIPLCRLAFINIPFDTSCEGKPKTNWPIVLAAGLLLEFLVLWALILRAALGMPDVMGAKVIFLIVLPIMALIPLWLYYEIRAGHRALAQGKSPPPLLSRRKTRVHRVVGALLAVLFIAFYLRTFVITPYRVETDSLAPEIPRGSHFLVWRLTRTFAPGDLIAYQWGNYVFIGRVTRLENGDLLVNKNGQPETPVSRHSVIGRVISIYWRGEMAVQSSLNPVPANAAENTSLPHSYIELPFRNTSMEEGTNTPYAWEKGYPVNGVQQIWDRTTAHSGAASLSLKKNVNRYFPIAQWSQDISVEPDDKPRKLRVRCWIKAQNVTKAIVDVNYSDEQDQHHVWAIYIGPKNDSDPLANFDWQLCEETVEVPAHTSGIGIAFEIYGPGQVWFDDLDVAWEMPGNTAAFRGPPFSGSLQQAAVELAFVGNEPWTNPVCWYPDGQPSPKAFPTGNANSSSSAEDKVVKKAAFYIRDDGPNGISLPLCRVTDKSGLETEGSIWEAPDQFRRVGYFGVELVCPSNALAANLALGLANGPWETVITMRHSPGTISGVGSTGDWSARYQTVKGANGDVAIGCSYNTRTNWVSRMAYLNDWGDIVPISETSGPYYGNTASGTVLISSNEYDRITQFLLQRRKLQWIEFENVSLAEGYKTVVQIRSNGIPVRPAQSVAVLTSQETPDELYFGPVHTVLLSYPDNPFINLDTGEIIPAHTGPAAELDRWKQEKGIDLFLRGEPDGSTAIFGSLIASEIANDRWATITPKEIITQNTNDIGNFKTNLLLQTGHTFTFVTGEFGIGVLRVDGLTGNNPRQIALSYKMIQVPLAFGPVIERVIDMTGNDSGNDKRALNLSSQSYVEVPRRMDEREFFSSTNDLRTAGVDLYGTDSGEVRAMDIRFWWDSNDEEDIPPGMPNPWTDVSHFPPIIRWLTEHSLYGMDANSPDYLTLKSFYDVDRMHRLEPHEDIINSTNVCCFTTRDGTQGVLQIAGYENVNNNDTPISDHYDSEHTRAIIRYRLVQSADMAQAKRQRFEPTSGMGDKTSWGVENHSKFNPDGWAVIAKMTLGGVARITPGMLDGKIEAPTAQSPKTDVCRIKLVDGNDDRMTLDVNDLKWNKDITVVLDRDQRADLTINGINYKIGYCSVWVAPDKPDTSPFANIVVTHSETK